jgi:hypothetical protein
LPFCKTWVNLSTLAKIPPAPNHPNKRGRTIDKGLTLLFADGDDKADQSFGYLPAGIVELGSYQICFPIYDERNLCLKP